MSEALRTARHRAGISHDSLGLLIGRCRRTIGKVEAGERLMSRTDLRAAAKALDADPAPLLDAELADRVERLVPGLGQSPRFRAIAEEVRAYERESGLDVVSGDRFGLLDLGTDFGPGR